MFFRLVLLIILPLMIFAKENYYYSFINAKGKLISVRKKDMITQGFQKLKYINTLLREGKIVKAKNEIALFKKDNKVKILNSDILLLDAKILLSTKLLGDAKKADDVLELGIDSSTIYENDLAKAYLLLAKANIKLNKIKKARFYAKSVIDNFKDPYIVALGKIAYAETYAARLDYNGAIRILYGALIKTNDIKVADLLGDELFNVYVLNKQRKKAYSLINQIMDGSKDFYIKHLSLAKRKIKILQTHNMPKFAVRIIKTLIKETKDTKLKDKLNFELAGIYMSMYDKTPKYLNKAKKIYRSYLAYGKKSIYEKKAQMYLDEILMREGEISTVMVVKRYKDSVIMKQKALLQELLVYKKKKDFEDIIKSEKVYRQISDRVARRFDYPSVQAIFNMVDILKFRTLAKDGKCQEINRYIPITNQTVFDNLEKNKSDLKSLFVCLSDYPKLSSYKKLKHVYVTKKNVLIYRYLEKMAYKLGKSRDAYKYSISVDTLGTQEDKKKEFLDKFKVFLQTKNPKFIKKFFIYASKHKDYIEYNQNNPVIIDFYYQYYLYLLQNNKKLQARIILDKLYKKQVEYKARVYSPFVELELAEEESENKNYKKALVYLEQALKFNKSNKNLPKIYYKESKFYGFLKEPEKKKEAIRKCKNIKGLDGNMYKKMCDLL